MNALFNLARRVFSLSLCLCALSSCKDDEPCDEGQESIGTGCYPRQTGGSGGGGTLPEAGAPAEQGGAGPTSNPNATFGTPCESSADCGADAPLCDDVQFHYCLQTECQDGEANAGACPADWICLKYQDNPSACIKL